MGRGFYPGSVGEKVALFAFEPSSQRLDASESHWHRSRKFELFVETKPMSS